MNKLKVVYVVECFGRGPMKLSQNITIDRNGLQKYIDKILNKRTNNIKIVGNSPDYFTALDTRDDCSGIRIYSKPVVDKFEDLDLSCTNALHF